MKNIHKVFFHVPAKKIKRIHVEGKMNEVGMDQATGKKTIPLFIVSNGRRIENEIIHDLFIAERGYGYKNRDDNNDDRDGQCHAKGIIKFKSILFQPFNETIALTYLLQ
jgi:hypothetical protein